MDKFGEGIEWAMELSGCPNFGLEYLDICPDTPGVGCGTAD